MGAKLIWKMETLEELFPFQSDGFSGSILVFSGVLGVLGWHLQCPKKNTSKMSVVFFEIPVSIVTWWVIVLSSSKVGSCHYD